MDDLATNVHVSCQNNHHVVAQSSTLLPMPGFSCALSLKLPGPSEYSCPCTAVQRGVSVCSCHVWRRRRPRRQRTATTPQIRPTCSEQWLHTAPHAFVGQQQSSCWLLYILTEPVLHSSMQSRRGDDIVKERPAYMQASCKSCLQVGLATVRERHLCWEGA